jgi:acyl carrier protein
MLRLHHLSHKQACKAHHTVLSIKEIFMAFTREDTFAAVANIIADKLSVPKEKITASATFKDLGADSLDIVEIIMKFEEAFGIEIKDEDAEKIQSIDQAVDLIAKARTK